MNRALIVLAAALLGCSGPTRVTEAARPADPVAAKAQPSSVEPDPAALYARYCALCHAEDRAGYAADHAPSLRSPELLSASQGRALSAAIAYGRPGTPMAAFLDVQGGPLSPPQIRALHDWLVGDVAPLPLPPTPIEGDERRGAAVYAERCAACHGAEGEGLTAPALSNPVYLATHSDAQIRDAIARGRTGTPMMAFADQLDAATLDDLTAFLRSRAEPWVPPRPRLSAPPPPDQAIVNADARPAKLTVRDGMYVPVDEVKAALDRGERIVLLDARPVSDWVRGHLPGALPVPFYDDLSSLVPHLPRDETFLVAYCACPHAASGRVARQLRARGFDRAVVLDEGSLVWAERGYPMVPGAVER